jgi:hypothetical protein
VVFDPGSGTWIQPTQMRAARSRHTATLLGDGRVLVVGGSGGDGTGALRSAELFDPRTGEWSGTGALASARTGHAATALPDGRVLVVGGYDGTGLLSSAEIYDPGAGAWAATGPMRDAREGHTATLLGDGSVLVTGGCLPTAERFDLRDGTWTTVAGPAEPRSGHTATLMTDGRVLVVGGSGCGTREPSSGVNGPVAAAELYDPAGVTWSAAGELANRRENHATVRLSNGTVLVVGGYEMGGSRGILDSAEVFGPRDGS